MMLRRHHQKCVVCEVDRYGYARRVPPGEPMPWAGAVAERDRLQAERGFGWPRLEVLPLHRAIALRDPDELSEAELRRHLYGRDAESPPPAPRVVITGRMAGLSRDEAKARARARGYTIAGSVGPAVTHVWAGESPGPSKIEAARRHGVPVVETLPEERSPA